MNDHDYAFYFTAVREDIQRMREEINERLDILNGTVRRHDTDIALLKSVSHPQNSCPIVFEVIKDVTELKQERAANSRLVKIAIGVGAAVTALAQVALAYFR